jgi:nitrogen-specific signal transduction histidine kinase
MLPDEEACCAQYWHLSRHHRFPTRARGGICPDMKLESVGTLASGIAHDFNNLLGGVLAQAELALTECAAERYPEEELKSIGNVAIAIGNRSSADDLCRDRDCGCRISQMFSRIVQEIIELLKVSVSKHAVLETDSCPGHSGNPSQMPHKSILLNLVTNAYDAIGARHGVILVSTRCVKGVRNTPKMA